MKYAFLLALLLGGISASAATTAACATCHAAQARTHGATGMANALEDVRTCDILKSHPKLVFQEGSYHYEITRDGNASQYQVSDGKQTLRVPIGWAFGLGSAGQTYVFQINGRYFESRVSYYKALNGLDLTVGAQSTVPSNLEEAAGHALDKEAARACFNCHATHASVDRKLDLSAMVPGVQCERCHGSAQAHLAGFRNGQPHVGAMRQLSKMSTDETSEFCGQCHRTWSQVATNGPHGINNIRFQPYRLTNSKCYDVDDARIRCTACHDPHREVVAEPASYDAKCQACHAAVKAGAKKCPVSASNCAGCHMPRLELLGSHNLFTDHQIRIVKKNEPYPN
ncbi:MAG TPA: hypothetical protein DEQ47_02670 [Solibacterales bacterium]|nr:hypothetical protein [Bryobacterales bacterium]